VPSSIVIFQSNELFGIDVDGVFVVSTGCFDTFDCSFNSDCEVFMLDSIDEEVDVLVVEEEEEEDDDEEEEEEEEDDEEVDDDDDVDVDNVKLADAVNIACFCLLLLININLSFVLIFVGTIGENAEKEFKFLFFL
jgi:hypothetical protein